MRSISSALARLHEDASWFARAHELRLLVVQTSVDMRKASMELLAKLEYHHDNASPWVLLEDSRTAEDDGWQARANRVLADWDRRREAFAKEGIELPAAAGPSARARPATGVEATVQPFRQAAAAVAAALRAPLQGLVLVLAPAAIDDPGAFEAELERLLQAPELSRCRWVLVLPEVEPPTRLLSALEDRALTSACLVDPARFERDVEELASGGARAGVAGPRGVVPPRRIDDPPELPREVLEEELRKAGLDPRYLEEAPRLRDLVMGAAVAMKQGRGADAVRMQREARDLAGQLGLHQLKVIAQITLASYLSGLDVGDKAVRELVDAAADARQHSLPVQESQAHLALGMLHAVGRRPGPAAESYVEAARVAEAAKMPLIAVEGWRLAGQLALEAKLEPQASRAFREAIRVASGTEPAVAQRSSAPEAARMLAALCRRHGLAAQADSLEAQARAIEAPEVAGAAPAAPGDGPAPAPPPAPIAAVAVAEELES